ncbi:hypothetical protein M1373_02775 [Candidatus Marsarchaeota archaeon]|nr:hypothetical protein [Candidatus Marsarchaeota archaeon]MCL5404886.1 hypothetical protein [Candidatus Marsarchaeota archaeon]
MKRLKFFIAVAALVLLAIAPLSGAQYWFQSGVRASSSDAFNNGASVSIETITPQLPSSGSFGYWIGETLSNGAFIQVGYEVPNETGYYPDNCTLDGCSGSVFLAQGYPTWFWEYFPKGYNGSSFFGGIGGNNSVGSNGEYNTYSFHSINDVWYIYFNSQLIGSVNLGTSNSGHNAPAAFAELASTYSNTTYMPQVRFKNMSIYFGNTKENVQSAFSYIGYGVGSETLLANPYGVEEISPYNNYFEVGSFLPEEPDNTQLWSIGYYLQVNSQYGNPSSSNNYPAYTTANISEPKYVYINSTTREKFVKWVGSGIGSYTGAANSTAVTMSSNITETAIWQTQYLVSLQSTYNGTYGSGWYTENSTARLNITEPKVPIGRGTRASFREFSNGATATNYSFVVDKPENLSVIWGIQYLVNASTPIGKVQGTGWYYANSTATLTLTQQQKQINSTSKLIFYSWSTGQKTPSISLTVTSPENISATYIKEFKVNIIPQTTNGTAINITSIYVNGMQYNFTSIFLPTGINIVNNATYGGVSVSSQTPTISVLGPGNLPVKFSVYNVFFKATDIFGKPISGILTAKFENGSESEINIGQNGRYVLYNVPNGNVTGTFEYFGISVPVSANGGSSIKVIMLTPLVIIAIIILLLFVVSFWFWLSFKHK